MAEAFTRWCNRYRVDPVTKKNKFAIVQAEDELASHRHGDRCRVEWRARVHRNVRAGHLADTQGHVGLAYFMEIPAVIFDVQRSGPSTGMPTRTQQSDILSAAYASHGDTKHVLLFPEDPREVLRVRRAVIRSWPIGVPQTPIFMMLDREIAHEQNGCASRSIGTTATSWTAAR